MFVDVVVVVVAVTFVVDNSNLNPKLQDCVLGSPKPPTVPTNFGGLGSRCASFVKGAQQGYT